MQKSTVFLKCFNTCVKYSSILVCISISCLNAIVDICHSNRKHIYTVLTWKVFRGVIIDILITLMIILLWPVLFALSSPRSSYLLDKAQETLHLIQQPTISGLCTLCWFWPTAALHKKQPEHEWAANTGEPAPLTSQVGTIQKSV